MKRKCPKSDQQALFRELLAIRLTFLMLMLSLFNVSASTSHAQSERVTISVENGLIREFFQQIENQTSYRFFYNSSDISNQSKVNAVYKDKELSEVLTSVLGTQNLTYRLLDNQIILRVATPKDKDQSQKAIQERILKGMVTTEEGTPLTGVTVTVEGSDRGVVTNFDGEYTIKLTDTDEVLKFIYLGYKTQVVRIDDQNTINVVMATDITQLDELVLIGYGQQKKEDVSGAISSVKTAELSQTSVGNVGFQRGLGGLVKGVQVTQNSGRPGAGIQMNIRGVTSPLSSLPGSGGGLNQPLYVIDGVPFHAEGVPGANPLLSIDPDNIESFNILKDAAATSIYGSRGANGVILIETKKGKRNEDPVAVVSYTTTMAKPINTVNVLNAAQYKDYYSLLIQNSLQAIDEGKLDDFFAYDFLNMADLDFSTGQAEFNGLNDSYFGDADTDWNKHIFRDVAITQKVNFNLRGGSSKTDYSFSLSHMNQEGLVINDKFEQYNLSLALNTDLSKKVTIGSTVNLSHSNAKSGEEDILGEFNVNTSVVRARPDLPVYQDNGLLMPQEDYSNGFMTLDPNPVMRLQNNQTDKAYSFIGNTFIEVEPIDKLILKADVNAAVFHSDNSTFLPKISQTDMVLFESTSLLSEFSTMKTNVVTNLTANYSFTFNNHNINTMAGLAYDRDKTKISSYFYSGFPDDEVLTNPSSAEEILNYRNDLVETGLNSIFSRVTYNYLGKYNLTFNFRSDKSSKFGPSNKRAYFPSLSASWNIAKEDFLKNSEDINSLRFRVGLGKVGSTNVADFAYLQFFNTSASDIYNGQSAVLPKDVFPNEDISWETTKEINVGLDAEFFNSRLNASIDVYNRKTYGALTAMPIPLELGPATYFANFIDVANKGLELSIGGTIIQTEDFSWNANVNWSLNRNKLMNLRGANINEHQLDYFVEGKPVGTIKGYRVKRIIQTQEEIDALNASSPTGVYDKDATGVGDFLYEDINGDGRITAEDRTVIGDIQPDFFGGFSTSFSYKNFDLAAFFQYSVGAEALWNGIPNSVFNILGSNKYTEYGLNTWTPENTDAKYAKAVYFDPAGNERISDRYLYDSSYLRFKSLQISYTLDADLVTKVGLDYVRFTLSGNNLITWTKWPGLDPEVFSERNSITSQTSNEDPYPLSKSFSVGVQVQF